MSESRATVSIHGVAEISRAMRRLESTAPRALKGAIDEAADFLVTAIRGEVPRLHGAAAGSVRAQQTGKGVKIRAGGSRAPYYPWLDFGGRVGRKKRTVRPYIGDGRYIFPTLAARHDAFMQTLNDAVVQALRDAGLEVD